MAREIKMKDGVEYELLYALRKKGKAKYDLVTEDKQAIISYLAKAHYQEEKTIIFSDNQHPNSKN